MTLRLTISILCAVASLGAAEFRSGQAARAVLGQPSFSARDAGVVATAMTVSGQRLYVADASNDVLTFDLTKIPGSKDDLAAHQGSGCAVCLQTPLSTISQRVAPGSAAVAVSGRTVAAIDTFTRRVLIWRDVSSPSASSGPDVILSPSDPQSEPSEATLMEPVSVALDSKRLFVGDAALHRVLVWNTVPASPNQLPDAVLGQHDFSSQQTTDVPRADVLKRPDALVSDGANLYVADSVDRRILVFSPSDLPLDTDSVVNSATGLAAPLASGTLITISATGLTDKIVSAPEDGSEPLPTKLAGVAVSLDGVPVPLLSISPTEIRAQLPYSIGNRSAATLFVRIDHGDGTVSATSPVSLTIAPASPGLFAFGGNEPRPGMLLHSGEAQTPVTSDTPAAAGEAVAIWATGLHVIGDQTVAAGAPYSGPDLSFTPVRALVNGQPAEVRAISLPATSVGIYE
ncbi:MAG: hypothetical protein JO061_18800, partial [Acidobacteriaceae bacterium]|nr:hypothetical protein [Acidobacteriaceae bacterium]